MKKNLNDLLKHEIKDLFSAESQLINALPKMAKAASTSDLQKAFESHLEETKGHKERLEKAAELLGFSPTGETCNAMQGLIEEGEEIIEMDADEDVKDAGLIASAQRVEHYEIAGYGTACKFAKMLGKEEVRALLKKTLDEEYEADSKLNGIAEEKVNEAAMS